MSVEIQFESNDEARACRIILRMLTKHRILTATRLYLRRDPKARVIYRKALAKLIAEYHVKEQPSLYGSTQYRLTDFGIGLQRDLS